MNEIEVFLSSIPALEWIVIGLVLILGFLYIFSKIRQQDMKILRDTNDDALKRIDQLEQQVTDQSTQIKTLQDKVEGLEKRNKTLEELVVVALKQYFFENPTVAKQIQKNIT